MPVSSETLVQTPEWAQQLAFYEGIAGDWRYILGWRENMYKIYARGYYEGRKNLFHEK